MRRRPSVGGRGIGAAAHDGSREKRKESAMKQHRFWAIACAVCMAMTWYTGRKHK